MTRRKAILLRIVLFAVALLAGLFVIELVGKHVLFKDKLYFADDVDHRIKPLSAPDINGDGIRCRYRSEHFRPEDFNVVFLGDSFVYGYDLPDSVAIPQTFERLVREALPRRGINVANFGWISASPLLCLRQLRDIGPRYNPDLVILCIDMTDFHDDIKYERLLERKGLYRLAGVFPVTIIGLRKALSLAPALAGLHQWLFGFPARKFYATELPPDQSRRYFAHTQGNIDALDLYCREELRARFMVVVLPRSYQYSERESPENWEAGEYQPLGPWCLEPFRYFEAVADTAGYPVCSLLGDFQGTEVFPTCFERDPHWNVAGTRIAARGILRCCLRRELVK